MQDQNPQRKAPGRPRIFDRDKALETALQMFWRYGYEGTSVAQLVGAIGITPPSFYAAFGSKEALYRETIGSYLKKYSNFVTRALASGLPVRESIRAMLYDAAESFSRDGMPRGCMVGSGNLRVGEESNTVADLLTDIRTKTTQLVEGRMRRAIEEGELPAAVDAHALAVFMACIIQGMSVQAIDQTPLAVLKQTADLALLAFDQARKLGEGQAAGAVVLSTSH